MERLSGVYCLAVSIRLILLVIGEIQDRSLEVKYTDIDYWVYTDASAAVLRGESPYSRLTYRYTPLLAYLLTPNVLFPPFGKLLFLLSDLLVGTLIERLATGSGKWCAAAWLLNPLVINVSTRGSSDTLCALLILATMLFLRSKKIVLAGLCYGLAVHFRIYPIVYAPSFFLYLAKDSPFYRVTKERGYFTLVSAGVFAALLCIFYFLYGWEFLFETYLYHFTRKDNRHNFSVYFYLLYLSFSTNASVFSLFAFLPQWVLLILTSFLCARHHLPLCLLVQTLVFVVFNKVVTAQYFLWYMCLLPLAVQDLKISLKSAFAMGALWIATEAHWLFWGYRLEFLGENRFFEIWIAGCLFFLVNCWIVHKLLRSGYESDRKSIVDR